MHQIHYLLNCNIGYFKMTWGHIFFYNSLFLNMNDISNNFFIRRKGVTDNKPY